MESRGFSLPPEDPERRSVIAARLINGRKGLFANMPFDEFVAWLCSEEGADEKADSHWLSQYEILGVQGPDPVCYDFIGRLERLSDDLDILAAKIGMPLSGVGHLLYSGPPKATGRSIRSGRRN